jgi:phosphohistidine phosphatase
MNLYLLRHGLAEDLGTDGLTKDSERPLTAKGEEKLRKIAAGMEALELTFDVILSSPYLRARQTAEIIVEALHARKKIEFSEALTPGGIAKKLIELLNRVNPEPQNVLLVGHEPHLSDLISLLVSGKPGCGVIMKKGGLCKLTAESLRHGRCADLQWLLTPGQMALMG